MNLENGSRLGSYEILDLLGAGGMGEVYRARDLKLGREVAIKVLPEEFARQEDRVSRFQREARMLAAVNHAAIAAIYGAEEDGDTRYIVMELVEGETLATRLAAGPLPVADALRIAAQIAEALEVAHAKGVIHRDLKPANIKITPEGRVKVLDFGLAKALDLPFSGDMSKSPTVVMESSRPGEIVGTPEFMSPEQARGKETDRRTDVWAFGCILFEMLSGKRAFTGETVSDAIASILQQEPDWKALPARTPPRVRELLQKCLEKDAGRRLRDAGDARLEIEATLAGMSGAAVHARTFAPGVRWRIVAAAVAGAALAIVAYFVLRSRPPATDAAKPRQLAVLPFRNLTNAAEGEAWGVGLADTVSARLSNIAGLQVVTPRAAVEAADPNATLASIARRLGANTLLSGTLQREKDRFRITYRLLDASGTQIAAAAVDGPELFDLQDRIANNVAKDLRVRRIAERTPTPSGLDTPAEQERYLQAIGLLQRYDRRDGVEKANEILKGLARDSPGSAIVQAALARADLALFRFTKDRTWADRALAATDEARRLDPGAPEVDVTVGETLLATGRAKEAVLAFRRALAARPGNVDALLGLGRASEDAGDDAAAEASFRRAIELQPSFAVFNQLAALYYDLGRYGDAAKMFRRAAEAAPDSDRALNNLGGTELAQCDFPAAVEAFHGALKLNPKNASALSNMGMGQLWSGHAAEAAATLERAAEALPDDFMIQGNLGDAYRKLGADPKAAEAYGRSMALARKQLELNPNDATAHCYVATSLAKTGHASEAAVEIKKAIALEPDSPDILSEAAVVSALAGRDAEALNRVRKAVAGGFCREIVAAQPEFARFRDRPEFRSIIAAPQKAAGS
jgi:Flp pilus assembly protein TadD/TolB-like protein/predicted Ser/Thr protein kinase